MLEDPGEPHQRLRLGARTGRVGRPPRGESDEHAHATATAEEDHEGEHVLGSPMVHVCNGGVKYQLTSRKPPTAATSAGQRPPSAETATTSSRNSRRRSDGDT